MHPALALSIALCWLPFLLPAQCDIFLTAGPDQKVCPPGGNTLLLGEVLGDNVVAVQWTPEGSVSDPRSLTPVAFGPGTYTLTAQVIDPTVNLIVNGDFSAGDSGFTTEYGPGTGGAFGPLSTEGTYAIVANSSAAHSNFAACSDHTGGGNMLVINGATTPNEQVWCQTVAVPANTLLSFTAWVASAISENPALLQFSVNGELLGESFRASSATCSWNRFAENWFSGGAMSAEICIVNQNTVGSGNDFAIDDIFFGPLCEQSDDVEVTLATVNAEAPATVFLPCDGGFSVVLDGSASSAGPGYFYQWSTPNGNILSGATTRTPTVAGAGTYVLDVNYDNGSIQCTDQTTVVVAENPEIPLAFVDKFGDITCNSTTVQLNALGSSSGPGYSYQWSTTDGFLVSGTTGSNPTVGAAGTYRLLVTHGPSGCTATAEVRVDEFRTPPPIQIETPAPLGCGSPTVQLDARPSNPAPGVQASWTTTDGSIVSGSNGLRPTVDAPGTYTLRLTDGATGCFSEASVTVVASPSPVSAQITPADTLSCRQTQIGLVAETNGNSTGFTYAWSTELGTIVAGVMSDSATVSAAGPYFLTVLDPATGCEARDTVVVVADLVLPDVAVSSNGPFTCGRALITLNSIGSSIGPAFDYLWSTNDGTILSDTTGPMPTIGAPGSYTLTIENQANGCRADSTLRVGIDTLAPDISAGTSFTLTCAAEQDTLAGAVLGVPPPAYTVAWTTLDGIILADADSLRAIIGAPGTYLLRVTNPANGCSALDSVRILRDDNLPTVTIATPPPLDCNVTTIDLNATGSNAGAGFALTWSSPNGNFLGATDGLVARIGAPGNYTLRVLNVDNGCVDSLGVVVLQDTVRPVVTAAPPLRLDCATPVGTLQATVNTAETFDFAWTTPNGRILAGSDGPSVQVDTAGTYRLVVSNPRNGCTTESTTTVTEDFRSPVAIVGPTQRVLTCRDTIFALGSTALVPDLRYAWQSSGTLPAGSLNGPSLVVNAPATYRLLVVDTLNACRDSAVVTVTEDREIPVATVETPAVLTCVTPQTTLRGSAPAGFTGLEIRWTTTGGNITSGATDFFANVAAAGTYQLHLFDPRTGCADSAQVEVLEDLNPPLAEAGLDAVINCAAPVATLSAEGSASGPSISYQWTTSDGTFSGPADAFTSMATAPGHYFLEVRNDRNGCAATDSVRVRADFVEPVVNLGPDSLTLTCRDTLFTLTNQGASAPGLQYDWSVRNGGALLGADTLPVAMLRSPGVYLLRISNPGNGCRAEDSVRIGQNTVLPRLAIVAPADLNCAVTELTLDATGSSAGAGFGLRWTTGSGNILSGATGPTPVVDAPGTYQLRVENLSNGCVDSAQVTVTQDRQAPEANIALPASLNCTDTLVVLDARTSSQGNQFRYTWTTPSGSIVAGSTTLSPAVAAPGTYFLRVTNIQNACFRLDSVTVTQDAAPPVLAQLTPEVLTCTTRSVLLNASASGAGAEPSVRWTTVNGNILSGEDSFTPRVDRPGDYRLLVINPENQCTNDLVIRVLQDTIPPGLLLPDTLDLGCDTIPVRLAAMVTDAGSYRFVWTTEGGRIVADGNTARPQVQGPGNYRVMVTNANNGCQREGNVEAVQDLPLDFTFSLAPPTCAMPLGTLTFTGVTGGREPYLYATDGGLGFRTDTVVTGLAPGNYPLVVQDAQGCELRASVSVPNPPELGLVLSPRVVIALGEDYRLNALTNYPAAALASVLWTPATGLDCPTCLRPRASPLASTVYTLEISTADGCVATASTEIIVDRQRNVFFPTAFSPNGDGINDVFIPYADPKLVSRVMAFHIYDRWGNEVFVGSDFAPGDGAAGWDGHFNGKRMNPAVFVFTATVEFVDGRQVDYRGEVALVQ
ncbi:gliding motility-associated C-terminal domain-containing protein [Neolewinella lacunae]|uniref:Gliding motility-associated C-terminal domain-containing protein n=1 Tax=Neolewinella lacunae TaxID=1517758 RepID=A0A923PPU2_9BACT|nr:gliding motility-associated C-terminal domain-containing protein [Neolewinella lacunae]MBC6995581.1 gliding motility-associated C-terminal domain-containing protein [Neolewinella lacunae]MDN3635617.1 gliding motility-associated C-terminal domain-containing protein [Neolewinella lacunae]